MTPRRRRFADSSWPTAALIAVVAAISASWNAGWHDPPRFDGAGYAVLGRAIAGGLGYREIDRPEAPRHAHFPPGYPVALALLWRVIGVSAVSAHILSAVSAVASTVIAWLWFRTMYSPRVAALLGLSFAINWTWSRTASAIQSEPVYCLLALTALLATSRVRRDRLPTGAGLGVLLGACTLTRHVGVALAAAVGADCLIRRYPKLAFSVVLTSAVVAFPWILWLAAVRENTQAALLTSDGLPERVASQVRFYVERLPDQITGPVVEVGTVFTRRKGVGIVADFWAVVATGIMAYGMIRALRSSRRQLAALVLASTLSLLVVWPFTEAGRFLIPLIPCILVVTVEGLAPFLRRVGGRRGAAWLILAVSLPYAGYALASGRAAAQRRTHDDFDAACAWLANEAKTPGPVLTRHPGEVYWQTGRQALTAAKDPDATDALIDRHGVAYLLVDQDRYANAPVNPLTAYAEARPSRVRLVFSRDTGRSAIRVYEVSAPPPGPRR